MLRLRAAHFLPLALAFVAFTTAEVRSFTINIGRGGGRLGLQLHR